MKKILLSALTLLAVVACSKFDDSEIWSELKDHEERIVKLETLCNQMNTNITSLQTIIIALQNNDYVTNISPIKEGSKEIGYTITFAKSGSITIYHGKDGENGKDGVNGTDGKDGQNGKDGIDGKDGKDGYTPKIGVKQHTDGKYYWTLDGTWLLDDNGNMIPTTGEDGTDGSNGKDGQDGEDGKDGENGTNGKDGKDGITPQLKIEDGYWYLSYDNGATWQKLGKATGNNGLDGLPGADGADGEDGDSIINSITQDDENVYFNLCNGQIITLPKASEKIIIFSDINTKLICLENWDINGDCEISLSEAQEVTSLNNVFKGTSIIIFNELKYFTGLTKIGNNEFKGCKFLQYVRLPETLTELGTYAFQDCSSLKRINIPAGIKILPIGLFHSCTSLIDILFDDNSQLEIIDGEPKIDEFGSSGQHCSGANSAFCGCTSLKTIKLPQSIKEIRECAFWGCTSLQDINLGELTNLTTIKGTRYYLSNNVGTTTCSGAFTNCSSLSTVYLPSSIRSLGSGIFAGCHEDLKIYVQSPTPCEITYYTFVKQQRYSSSSYFSVYVPLSSVDTYKATELWKSRTIIGY